MAIMQSGGSNRTRGGKIALAISLVLNLFLLAVIGGHWLQIRRAERANVAVPGPAAVLARAERELSPRDAAAFDAIMRRDAPRFSQSMQQATQARQALRLQFLAEPFDEAATRQALATWVTDWNRLMGDFSEPLVDAMAHLSPEGRRRLVRASRARALGPLR